jgi:hypothetical protein
MEAPRANFVGIKADALNAPEALILARLSEWQKTTAFAPAGRHRRQYAAGGRHHHREEQPHGTSTPYKLAHALSCATRLLTPVSGF